MEVSIILNVVFLSLVSIGFILYQIWLGSKVVKLQVEKNNLINEISHLYDVINQREDEIRKSIDRVDSNFDQKIKNLSEEHHHNINAIYDDLNGVIEKKA